MRIPVVVWGTVPSFGSIVPLVLVPTQSRYFPSQTASSPLTVTKLSSQGASLMVKGPVAILYLLVHGHAHGGGYYQLSLSPPVRLHAI